MRRLAPLIALGFLALEPAFAQYGAVGLSAVRAQRYGNEGFSLFTPHSNDLFGWALVAGDFNGDGHADLAIGAPYENDGVLIDTGAEWVLYGSCFSDGFEVANTVRWSASVP